MVRYIALLLVLSTAGVILAEAQCRTACTVDRPHLPLKQTRCHHHPRPSSQQCMYRHHLTPAQIRTASPATVPLPATGREAASFGVPVPDRACGAATFTAVCAQSPGPPSHTALRI